MKCRYCNTELTLPLIDLGSAPPSNAYLTNQTLHLLEEKFPLRVLVCERCWLVQTEDFTQADELFDKEYAYFSSFSTSWLEHAKKYVTDMVNRFALSKSSHVVEVAANDGYLLQYVKEKNIPCTGIEPTNGTATVAREKGIFIVEEFFGVKLARQLINQGKQADLAVANNVLAHVPDINDFVAGFSILLKSNGVATFEFPHLLKLITENQFDTIYHEHFSYLSLIVVEAIFKKNGLQIFDVEELSTHGGSLRIFAQRTDTGMHILTSQVTELRNLEIDEGMASSDFYKGFQKKADDIKDSIFKFLIDAQRNGKSVAAYGAAAKGNTLLNYAGIKPNQISYVVDKNPNKQGKYMPGSHIPIVSEQFLKNDSPDYVVILPWNLKDEIISQLGYIKENGGKFVTIMPVLEII
jgi:2-polyprenyl-3-methyl-5-hydroxy-6-metoxy-1,4-benzoquinol methylase